MTKQNVIETFKSFITDQQLIDQKLLLMVSGGIDSVVLLDVAAQCLNTNHLAVFHLNHNARVESKTDSLFVQNLCSKYGVRFYEETLTLSPKNNVEATWRKERKRAALKAARDFGTTHILTAHHATDLAETMLFRLTKGAGPSGLTPFKSPTKPFWKLPKTALQHYATEKSLSWREDESNLNTKFERNLIRVEVLPALRKITPNLESVFVRESETFAELQDFLTEQLQLTCAKELPQKSIKLEKFNDLHRTLQNEFLRTIATKTPSQSEIEDCLKWLQGNPAGNSQKAIGGTQLEIKQKHLTWDS